MLEYLLCNCSQFYSHEEFCTSPEETILRKNGTRKTDNPIGYEACHKLVLQNTNGIAGMHGRIQMGLQRYGSYKWDYKDIPGIAVTIANWDRKHVRQLQMGLQRCMVECKRDCVA